MKAKNHKTINCKAIAQELSLSYMSRMIKEFLKGQYYLENNGFDLY